MPWLQRVTQLQPHAAMLDSAVKRKTEFALRREPCRIELVSGALKIGEHAEKILPHEMRQHEAVMQRRAPAHARAVLRLAPEPRDQRAHQQLLRERHARVRRHLEGAEFDEPEPPDQPLGRVELVDADFGAMRVAGDVDQQIAQQPVDQPRARFLARLRDLRERDFEFVQRLVTRLVDARRLAGRAR